MNKTNGDANMHPSIQNQQAVSGPALTDALVNLATLQNMLDEALAATRPEWIPCRRGCLFCCWQMNELISWLEAAQIFNAVRDWDADAKAALVARANREVDALVADPDVAQFVDAGDISPDRLTVLAAAFRKHIRPCVFLDRAQGACMIYEARPTHCRVFGQSVVERRDDDAPAFYGCTVAADEVRSQIEASDEPVELFDVTEFFKAQRLMEGAPNVVSLPLAFWVKAVAGGPDWSLDFPENLFDRFMPHYKPLQFEAARSEDASADAQYDAPPDATEIVD